MNTFSHVSVNGAEVGPPAATHQKCGRRAGSSAIWPRERGVGSRSLSEAMSTSARRSVSGPDRKRVDPGDSNNNVLRTRLATGHGHTGRDQRGFKFVLAAAGESESRFPRRNALSWSQADKIAGWRSQNRTR
jgi:hypothetical protein